MAHALIPATAIGFLLASITPAPASAPVPSTPELTLEVPRVALRSVPFTVEVSATGPLPEEGLPVRIGLRTREGEVTWVAKSVRLTVNRPRASVRLGAEAHGRGHRVLAAPVAAVSGSTTARAPATVSQGLVFLPGFLSLAPPVLAIGLALWLRTVVPALFAGVWLGAFLVGDFRVLGSFLRSLDHYVTGQLLDADHVKIILFSLLLGGMVGLVTRAGGAHGIVEALRGWATSPRRGQLSTWAMGILVFFDDYANTLIVGNTMRPLTDRLRISREKLAYIVDSTAAPVATFALLSTWIGFEVGLIGDSLRDLGSGADPYGLFLRSIPFRFYSLLTLVFVALVALSGRDFGPMAAAESRAASGRLLRPGSTPLADWSARKVDPPAGQPRRAWNALVPIGFVIVVTFLGLWFTGRAALADRGDPLGTDPVFTVLGNLRALGSVFGAGSSFDSLLWGSAGGCLLAVLLGRVQRLFRLDEAMGAWLEGIKAMLLGMVILILAWSVGEICRDLHTADYLVHLVSGVLHPRLLPLVVFLVAAGVSFATGSSWSTMGILLPLAVPLAHQLSVDAALADEARQLILLGSISSVLAGAIFGDHCSPISDTTVMSSTASACDHVDHVRTQLPYALLVAAVALALGTLPAAFGLSPWIGLAAGVVVLWLILRLFGRRVQPAPVKPPAA